MFFMQTKEFYKRLDNIFKKPIKGRALGLFFLWFNGVLISLLIEGFSVFSHPISATCSIMGLYPWAVMTVMFTNGAHFSDYFFCSISLVLAVYTYGSFFINPVLRKYIMASGVLWSTVIYFWLKRLYFFIF